MTRYIAVCVFTSEEDPMAGVKRGSDRQYEYLLPEGCGEGTTAPTYAVVCPPDRMHLADFKVVKIKSIRELVEQQYEGDLKTVVAAFSTDGYIADKERLSKRRALLVQIEKKVAERSKVKALEDLAGSDPEAKALLDAFKAL